MTDAEEFASRLDEARRGSVEEMLYAGWALLHGVGTAQNTTEAIGWWDRAATLGSVEAKVRLAEIYETGKLVQQDCAKARRLYEEALGDPGIFGPYVYGVAHYFGSSCIAQDYAKARDYFAIAAKRGHFVSGFLLAKLLRTGRFGFGQRLWGYLLPIITLCRAVPSLVRSSGDYEEWWDAQRWLSDRGLTGKLRLGTRFE